MSLNFVCIIIHTYISVYYEIHTPEIDWDRSGFVRLFLILTKNIFLTGSVRYFNEKHGIIG